MKKNLMAMLSIAGLIALLSGCTPVQRLDSAESRVDAVYDEMTLIAEAVSLLDPTAIEQLQCAEPRLIELPEPPAPDTPPPLIEVDGVEPLDLSGSNFTDPDPGAQFYLASLRASGSASERDPLPMPDVIVRVDDSEACLWAMAPPFVVQMGL
ncbi:hypothetical protein [Microbacterium sp. H1-D42]|uniref:hypothetical protein n=1 Tax=Microbacterium sp. H1-D42 TaxID=2925844 RepID=UPI001F52B9D9|nr:hypothetical protein [Microbacterium sp. H1-D42]UNK72245.1 hypothetical protein MNR00_07330 [Microbacterium sp. H1-D42]